MVPRRLTARQRELIKELRETERPAAAKPAAGAAAGAGTGTGAPADAKGTKKDGSPRKRGGFWGKMKDSLGG
jgi:hypothetical protein